MTVYLIADVMVTDDSWMPEYTEKAHDIVHKHGAALALAIRPALGERG